MKNLKWICILILVHISACDKLLDIRPKNVAVAEDVLKSTAQIKLLLNSAYDAFRNDKYMGGSTWLAAELMVDNLDAGSLNNDFLALYNRNSTVFNDVSRQIWNHGYIVIYRVNLVLEALETAQGIRPEDLAKMRGQALFIRAFCHFELVQLFAQPWGYSTSNEHLGIPLRLSTVVSNLPRATVQEVYDQILNDLNTAIQELPAGIEPGVANVWTAKALMAKVFFQRNEFFFALKFSKDVVENAPYIFDNKLNARFAETGNTENILELVNEDKKSIVAPSGKILRDYYYSANVYPQIKINESIPLQMIKDPGDIRLKNWIIKDTSSSQNYYYCAKFNHSITFRVPIIHLTEIKLIYAESAAEQNDLQRAGIQINDIRKRAGLVQFSSANKQAHIAQARLQRHLELFCEGNRLHELKRMAIRDNTLYFIRKAPWNCNGLVLAIPDDEMSANSLIIQNPSGGCN